MLKSLTLNGFKSFAKKSELEFGSSVTAIVGPNGSGKSNVVESFRFVLGEQSIKSMRGRSGSDLIFKGSKSISKLNRAKSSVVFDNAKRIFKLDTDAGNSINLDFEQVEISREVFTDGTNKYSVNGTEVRLKDVHELLASVHIGSSGHHIISQGQADRLLSASGKDRREMIEDALGLKMYQIKMKDAERKLDRTEQNIKEVESLRREIAPHIRYLKKQVEKIKQAEDLRESLGGMYKEYLAYQDHFLSQEYDILNAEQTRIIDTISDLDTKLQAFGPANTPDTDVDREKRIQVLRQEIDSLTQFKNEVSRKVGRLEVMIEMAGKQSAQSNTSHDKISIPRDIVDAFIRDLYVFVDQALKSSNLQEVQLSATRLQTSIRDFGVFVQSNQSPAPTLVVETSQDELQANLADLQSQLSEVESSITEKTVLIQTVNLEIQSARNQFYESQRERFEIEKARARVASEYELVKERISRAREMRVNLEEEIQEGIVLVGQQILGYGEISVDSSILDKTKIEELRRQIERTKIKLEEAGALGGEESLREYEEVSTRDEFLNKELEDLESGTKSLKILIDELRTTLDKEFKEGVKKINTQFNEFFSIMFGGGSASLSVVTQKKRKQSTDGQEDLFAEEGVEVEVNLPQKKVKELTMLSGGERSLTSIALLFAITQVNPPPFLVLDETDAALDEANSRRYGDMIERLAQYSQLIVVTHNRETMSRAETIYGVTIGSDGASKLLSIKFGDAQQYAK